MVHSHLFLKVVKARSAIAGVYLAIQRTGCVVVFYRIRNTGVKCEMKYGRADVINCTSLRNKTVVKQSSLLFKLNFALILSYLMEVENSQSSETTIVYM